VCAVRYQSLILVQVALISSASDPTWVMSGAGAELVNYGQISVESPTTSWNFKLDLPFVNHGAIVSTMGTLQITSRYGVYRVRVNVSCQVFRLVGSVYATLDLD
jgi:hypothetical protein